jgi:signal transduction histidine kinase
MRHPWQYWATFVVGLALVLPAMLWLTLKAMELDQANAVARRQAELEQDIGRALWRMDAKLTPLLAQEAARPDFVYRTRYATICEDEPKGKGESKPQAIQTLSPLVADPPEYVLLHFEVLPDGQVISPQSPAPKEISWAIDNGARQETIKAAAARLQELRQLLADRPLVDQLPQEALPSAGYAMANSFNNSNLAQNTANPLIINKPYAQRGGNYNNYESGQAGGQPQQQAAQIGPGQAVPAQPLQLSQNRSQQSDFENNQQFALPQPDDGQLALANQSPEGNRNPRQQLRAGNDLENRDAALQAFTQKAVAEQRQNQKLVIDTTPAVEGVSQPLWLGGRLLLARRVQVGNQVRVQGCWLDWDRLQEILKAEVADLLPNVNLTPVTNAETVSLGRLLATLPVQLSVPMPSVQPAPFSPIRVSLLVAWGCLLFVTFAAAVTLQSVVQLSERRASFVSAVTHELRTPLTTFRMYAEMLAGGMVPDPEQRQHYLETLRVEADRLAHLVDNVLQYARLERTNPNRRRQSIAVHELFDRLQSRLADRARQAEMELVVDTSACDEQFLNTDPQAVEQILFNLVDNACKYAAHSAKKQIDLSCACDGTQLTISVRDYGPGISAAGRKKLFRPFSKSVHDAAISAPGVGLGLALCHRLARDLGGRLDHQPAEPGCEFCLRLPAG